MGFGGAAWPGSEVQAILAAALPVPMIVRAANQQLPPILGAKIRAYRKCPINDTACLVVPERAVGVLHTVVSSAEQRPDKGAEHMNESLDLDKINTKNPDNHKIDKYLRDLGNDPNNLEATCKRVSAEEGAQAIETLVERDSQKDLLIRPRRLTYFFGPQHPVGAGFINKTNKPAEKELGWTEKVGTKMNFSVSTTASASVMGLFTASITASFGMEWSTEKTFSDSFKITLDPGEYGWLTRRGMTCNAEVDFIIPSTRFSRALGIPGMVWQGTIEGYAGNDGRPDSWITGHAQRFDPSLLSALDENQLPQFVQVESDGLLINSPLHVGVPVAV
jgi:hypothetical protein